MNYYSRNAQTHCPQRGAGGGRPRGPRRGGAALGAALEAVWRSVVEQGGLRSRRGSRRSRRSRGRAALLVAPAPAPQHGDAVWASVA